MKFLLKIVQGPNAGAEIALVEGVRVTLGSADACDIVLADPTLPAEACAIEAAADSVVLTPPGAEPERLEPLRVRSFGSTALAVGPADAPWGPLSWEAPRAAEPPAGASEAARPESAPETSDTGDSGPSSSPSPDGTEGAESRPAETPSRNRGRRLVCLVLLLLLLFLLVLLGLRWGWHRFLDKAAPEMLDEAFEVERTEGLLSSIAARYGLTLVETNGTTLVRGDFDARAERLKATAELYEAQPGLSLDLADRETLLSTASELLQAATDGALQIADVTNRVAVLSGRAPDPAKLRDWRDFLLADVPRLSGADTAAVVLDSPVSAPANNSSLVTRHSSLAPKAPRLPLCGILLQPYPCLVLQNGQRLAVGAEVGGYKIERIARDRITLRRGEEAPVEWTP